MLEIYSIVGGVNIAIIIRTTLKIIIDYITDALSIILRLLREELEAAS